MRRYKVNGGRHYSTYNLTKGKRKYGLDSCDIHGKKLFFGYFTLGIFGSPEKDQGFVMLMLVTSPHFSVLGTTTGALVLTWIPFFFWIAGFSFISFLTVC